MVQEIEATLWGLGYEVKVDATHSADLWPPKPTMKEVLTVSIRASTPPTIDWTLLTDDGSSTFRAIDIGIENRREEPSEHAYEIDGVLFPVLGEIVQGVVTFFAPEWALTKYLPRRFGARIPMEWVDVREEETRLRVEWERQVRKREDRVTE